MLRTLIRTPRRRLVGLVLLVALAWAAWALGPPKPAARWSLPDNKVGMHLFTPDGRTVVTTRLERRLMLNGTPLSIAAGPLVVHHY